MKKQDKNIILNNAGNVHKNRGCDYRNRCYDDENIRNKNNNYDDYTNENNHENDGNHENDNDNDNNHENNNDNDEKNQNELDSNNLDNDNSSTNHEDVNCPFNYPISANDAKWKWREMLQTKLLKNEHCQHIKKMTANDINYKNSKQQNQIKKSSILKFACPLHDLKPCLEKCNYKTPAHVLCNGYSQHCKNQLFQNNKQIYKNILKVAEYNFSDLNIRNNKTAWLETALNIQVIIQKENKLDSLITVPIHILRTNESTFEKRFRPGLYNFENKDNIQNKDKNKIGTWLHGKLFYVRLNDIVLLQLIPQSLYLQVTLFSEECHKKRDGLYDIIGGVGLCQLQKHRHDGIHNCIILRSSNQNALNVLMKSKISIFQFCHPNHTNHQIINTEVKNCQINVFLNNKSLNLCLIEPTQSIFNVYSKNNRYNWEMNEDNKNCHNNCNDDDTDDDIKIASFEACNDNNNVIAEQNKTKLIDSTFQNDTLQQQQSQQLPSLSTIAPNSTLLQPPVPMLSTPTSLNFEKNNDIFNCDNNSRVNSINQNSSSETCVSASNIVNIDDRNNILNSNHNSCDCIYDDWNQSRISEPYFCGNHNCWDNCNHWNCSRCVHNDGSSCYNQNHNIFHGKPQILINEKPRNNDEPSSFKKRRLNNHSDVPCCISNNNALNCCACDCHCNHNPNNACSYNNTNENIDPIICSFCNVDNLNYIHNNYCNFNHNAVSDNQNEHNINNFCQCHGNVKTCQHYNTFN